MKAPFRHSDPTPADGPARQPDPVYGITTADEPLSADIARRQKQYLISMAFRLVTIAVVVWVPWIDWQIKVVLGIIATVIPFFAVVAANGAPAPDHQSTNLLVAPPGPPAIEGPDRALQPGEQFYTGESTRRGDSPYPDPDERRVWSMPSGPDGDADDAPDAHTDSAR